MLNSFLQYFQEKSNIGYTGNLYKDFLSQLGGKQFGKGLFNSFSEENIAGWTTNVSKAYSAFKNRFRLFGYDWLGRCFGIDLRENTYGNILMFEIGTGYVLEIPCSFEEFLNEEIPLHSDACLAEPFFEKWQSCSNETIDYGQCVGYKVPLFLGGEDAVENLEISDMDVYWAIMSQIKNQIL